jgi:hypothetical protein
VNVADLLLDPPSPLFLRPTNIMIGYGGRNCSIASLRLSHGVLGLTSGRPVGLCAGTSSLRPRFSLHAVRELHYARRLEGRSMRLLRV